MGGFFSTAWDKPKAPKQKIRGRKKGGIERGIMCRGKHEKTGGKAISPNENTMPEKKVEREGGLLGRVGESLNLPQKHFSKSDAKSGKKRGNVGPEKAGTTSQKLKEKGFVKHCGYRATGSLILLKEGNNPVQARNEKQTK